MNARTRRILTAVSLLYIAVVACPVTRLPMPWFNLQLALTVAPLVCLIGLFARASAHQHANRWARDIEKVQGGRPAPLPHQEAVSR